MLRNALRLPDIQPGLRAAFGVVNIRQRLFDMPNVLFRAEERLARGHPVRMSDGNSAESARSTDEVGCIPPHHCVGVHHGKPDVGPVFADDLIQYVPALKCWWHLRKSRTAQGLFDQHKLNFFLFAPPSPGGLRVFRVAKIGPDAHAAAYSARNRRHRDYFAGHRDIAGAEAARKPDRDRSARIRTKSGADLLAQRNAINLAHVHPRQCGEKMHSCRWETGGLSGDCRLQFVRIDRALRLNGNVQFLACIFPRDREHAHVLHAEFLLERLFDRFG